MNYKASQKILNKIKESEKILLSFHHNPDADSVGSVMAFCSFLQSLRKDFCVLSITPVPSNLHFLTHEFESKIRLTDYSDISFDAWDLFLANDSSSWFRISGRNEARPPIKTIVIDHHKTNKSFGDINLIDDQQAANCQIVYKLFRQWDIKIDSYIAKALLSGIIGDTGAFRFPEAGEETFEIASELMALTDKNEIIFNLFQSYGESHVGVWKEIMENIEIDKKHRFVHSFIDKNVMEKYKYPDNAKAEIADMIFQSIAGTDFGLVAAMDKKGYMSVSFRSRKDVDVSLLAHKLGGGGHRWAAACRVDRGDFVKNKETVLSAAREFAKEIK